MVDSDDAGDGVPPLVRAGHAAFQAKAEADIRRAKVAYEVATHDAPPTDAAGQARAASVATPDELVRTALRILILTVHRGLGRTPAKLRQAAEARAASQALYAASDFFNREYDPAHLSTELQHLANALVPLAIAHNCDPFMLHLYAVGDLPWRAARGKSSTVRPLRGK